jgi:uncharacterized membrane protein YagU involved in acid resistance
VVLGGLVAGALDMFEPIVFWHFYRGTPPIRIPQSIAAGLFGRQAAIDGGWKTAALGLALHFFIATSAALVYVLVSRRRAALVERPLKFGLIYGLGVFLFMNLIVVPVSQGGAPTLVLPVLINNVLAHLLLIGLPIAFLTRRYTRPG